MAAVQERTLSVWESKIKPKIQVAGSGPPVVFSSRTRTEPVPTFKY